MCLVPQAGFEPTTSSHHYRSKPSIRHLCREKSERLFIYQRSTRLSYCGEIRGGNRVRTCVSSPTKLQQSSAFTNSAIPPLVCLARFELATYSLGNCRSLQLSYKHNRNYCFGPTTCLNVTFSFPAKTSTVIVQVWVSLSKVSQARHILTPLFNVALR